MVLLGCSPRNSQVTAVSSKVEFFENISGLCGSTFLGEAIYPESMDEEFMGTELKMNVLSCSESEIRIPFHVGNDSTRTWVLTLTDDGLLFKHHHVNPDGSVPEITNYGGWAIIGGSSLEQSFIADAETAILIPEARRNVWSMKIDLETNQFIYYLERNESTRFKAAFSLN